MLNKPLLNVIEDGEKTAEKNETKSRASLAQIKINKGGLTARKVLTRRIINFSHLRIKRTPQEKRAKLRTQRVRIAERRWSS